MHNTPEIKLVLVNTTHPGNIGAAARAMKTMGIKKLCLVGPEHFPHVDATARAAGADNILEEAEVCDSVDEALKDSQLIIGTSARTRSMPLPIVDPKECAELIFSDQFIENKVAILFGTERSGLSNEDLMRCHYHLYVPTMPDFYSLNMASAVQIIAYELRMASLAHQNVEKTDSSKELANQENIQLFYKHLEKTLKDIQFLKPSHSPQLMQNLKRLFNRLQLETRELNILRGILSAVDKK